MKKIILLIFLSVSLLNAQSSSEHLSGFSTVSLTYKVDQNWMIYGELQERSVEDFSKPDYYEIKGGAGYNFSKQNQAFIGLGRYANYTNSSISKEEFRIWLQYTYSFNLDKLKIDNRLRAEKRFFHDPVKDINTNDERYRYRLAATYPINHEKLDPNTVFVNTYDEIFVGPTNDLFKRNRVFGGIGYVFNEHVSTNLGYLWQRELYPTVKNLHFLYLGFNFTLSKHAKEIHHVNPAD